jgi:GNAT superfamily N-acetyltransferase
MVARGGAVSDGPAADDPITYAWRGSFTNAELNPLHAEGFGHAVLPDDDWVGQVERHSLGWVTARDGDRLVGFVNVAWDGGVHAFLLDTLVRRTHRGRGIGTRVVALAVSHARDAGCEWLHVDWDEDLRRFYLEACGFVPTEAGLIGLR